MKIKIINKSGNSLPKHQTGHAAAVDLMANLDKPVTLESLGRVLVPTGLYIALPPGYEAQIRPRSGLSLKHGITMINSPGTIDADYRGEVGVLLVNLSDQPYTICNGERIAQMVVAKHEVVEWEQVEQLDQTARNSGGFGHTGK